VQLGPPADRPPAARDLATALEQARVRLGNRPAVTVLSPRGREEQAVASLAQWAAKGAHLLEADLLLAPGDAVRLDAPWSWPAAAVCLAAWWAGLAGELDPHGDAEVAVLDEHVADPPDAGEVLRVGDAITGAPLGEVAGEAWTLAVQAFPDQPPRPQAAPDRVALTHRGRSWTQVEVLDVARDLGQGTMGLTSDRPADVGGDPDPAVVGLVALAVRPLLAGRPTVVLRGGVAREAAAGERVATWWPPSRDPVPLASLP
jgi:uncharacterized protein (TIGR03089 family)